MSHSIIRLRHFPVCRWRLSGVACRAGVRKNDALRWLAALKPEGWFQPLLRPIAGSFAMSRKPPRDLSSLTAKALPWQRGAGAASAFSRPVAEKGGGDPCRVRHQVWMAVRVTG